MDTALIAPDGPFSDARTQLNALITELSNFSVDITVQDYTFHYNLNIVDDLFFSNDSLIRWDRSADPDACLKFDESDDLLKFGFYGGSFTGISLVGHNHDDRYFTETEITTNYYTNIAVDVLLTDYFLLDGTRALQGNLMLDGYWISDDGGDEGIRVDSDGEVEISDHIRASTTKYRRYYHIPMTAANAVGGGATWVSPNANHIGGWGVTLAAHLLTFEADVHADWDAASDIIVEIYFVLNASGSNNDTVDLKLVAYYNGIGETSCKTQTVEVPTITTGTQYKVYKAEFVLDYDLAGNVIEVGDKIGFLLNLEVDTSEIDDIIITSGSFSYNTSHVGIEDGDI